MILAPFVSRRTSRAPALATLLAIAGLVSSAVAHAQTTLTLPQIMADPDWIGQPVQDVWWQLDGSAVHYTIERPDSDLIDTHRIDWTDQRDTRLDHPDRATIDGPNPILSPTNEQAAFVRDGNVFVRDLNTGVLTQLTQSRSSDRQLTFSTDGQVVYFSRAGQWHGVNVASGLQFPVADLRFEADPNEASDDHLSAMQRRLFTSLARDQAQATARAEARRLAGALDPTQSPAPWFLGEDDAPVASALSPDGRHLLMAVAPADYDEGREGQMPHYVTFDGYIKTETVRTRVGRRQPPPHQLWLLDLVERTRQTIDLSGLSAIDVDPLADLKAANGLDPLPDDQLRDVSIQALQWHPSGAMAAVQIRARDNKDRWIATLSPDSPQLVERHRLNDPAWINWRYNDMGWLGEATEPKLWWLSEHSGFSHLYLADINTGVVDALTEGEFEVSAPTWSRDEQAVFVLANPSNPGRYDLYRLDINTGDWTDLTRHGGVESFALHPTDDRVVLRYSESYLPPQVGRLASTDTGLEALTDTRKRAYRDIDWQAPRFVRVPGSHGQGSVPAKFYPARTPRPAGGHPVVLFVHGAGYLQNVWHRYPNYFREQMFHNFLTERGYHVLDMDFRASAGYGRDWRTAIYRQMGTPELEDLIDGVRWLVDEHGANPDRVGLYGGSYGGFMTFMALFNAPDVFHAGAALRPVSDWAHYNHPYTSNILNTPEVDPEAYRRSSPIEFAEGLEGHLLMTHGMLDDNVFYQDVIRLSQRLIDLEKSDWELASYPLERHGFERPSSWLDQYRRIYGLFEETIGYGPSAERTSSMTK